MHHQKRLLTVITAALLAGAVNGRAYYPDGWVMLNQPYAYAYNQLHWFYLNPADAMFCYDYIGGTWSTFPSAFSGWIYFQWPHGFSLNTGRWYYFNGMNAVLCYNLIVGDWTLLGQNRYSNADAEGTWVVNELMVQATTQDILTGYVLVNEINGFSGFTYDGAGTEDAITGFAFVNNVGIADVEIAARPDPQPLDVCAWKSHAASSHTGSGGAYAYIYALTRRGASYSTGDLPGTWVYQQVQAAASDAHLVRGPIVIDGGLNFTAYFSDENGDPSIDTGTCSINASGVATMAIAGGNTRQFDVSATKDVMLRAWMEGSNASFGIGIRRGPSYSLADACGTWRYSLIRVGQTIQESERGTFSISPTGTTDIRAVTWDGKIETDRITASMAADGLLNVGGRQFQLSAGHAVMAGVWAEGSSMHLLIALRNLE